MGSFLPSVWRVSVIYICALLYNGYSFLLLYKLFLTCCFLVQVMLLITANTNFVLIGFYDCFVSLASVAFKWCSSYVYSVNSYVCVQCSTFLHAFTKLRKDTVSFITCFFLSIRLSVCLSVCLRVYVKQLGSR